MQVPVLGGLFYLVFGAGREKKYAEAKRRADAELEGLLPDRDEEDPGDCPPALREVWDLAGALAGHPAAGANAVHIESDARAALGAVLDAIDAAERTVCAQFYTLRNDEIGNRFVAALTRAAERGVEVRLLFDRFGSIKLFDSFLDPLEAAGGRVVPFQPRGNGLLDRARLNLRNHRKIVVVDAGRGFCGGVNVGDEYMNRVPACAPWRDTLAEVRGPAAGRLTRVFAQDWLYMTGERLADERFYQAPDGPAAPGGGWLENVVLRVLGRRPGPPRPGARERVLRRRPRRPGVGGFVHRLFRADGPGRPGVAVRGPAGRAGPRAARRAGGAGVDAVGVPLDLRRPAGRGN